MDIETFNTINVFLENISRESHHEGNIRNITLVADGALQMMGDLELRKL